MPNLPVAFNTVREILSNFLTEKQLGFSEIEPCPFGQAYVKLNSVLDRDDLVTDSPHQFTDVHVIFEKHDKGMNWRSLVLNRDAWILLCGYPFDRRNIQEVSNAVSKFGKFLMWDRIRSTRENLMVKVRVEELRDIPTSIVFGEGYDFQTGSLTVPVVIIQHQILGVEAPDEDPVAPHGNPHPMPQQANYHPNQQNHFLGPLQQHEQEDNQAPAPPQVPQVNLQLALNAAPNEDLDMNEDANIEEDDQDHLPGWGHWAMPQEVDMEIQAGEFLAMNELIWNLWKQRTIKLWRPTTALHFLWSFLITVPTLLHLQMVLWRQLCLFYLI